MNLNLVLHYPYKKATKNVVAIYSDTLLRLYIFMWRISKTKTRT